MFDAVSRKSDRQWELVGSGGAAGDPWVRRPSSGRQPRLCAGSPHVLGFRSGGGGGDEAAIGMTRHVCRLDTSCSDSRGRGPRSVWPRPAGPPASLRSLWLSRRRPAGRDVSPLRPRSVCSLPSHLGPGVAPRSSFRVGAFTSPSFCGFRFGGRQSCLLSRVKGPRFLGCFAASVVYLHLRSVSCLFLTYAAFFQFPS